PKFRQRNLTEMRDQCALLLSILAYAGAQSFEDAAQAFACALEPLGFVNLDILPKANCKLPQLESALAQLNEIKPLQKPKLLIAMSQCITHDNKISIFEADLSRAIADALDCPVPPLIPSPHYSLPSIYSALHFYLAVRAQGARKRRYKFSRGSGYN